MLRQLPDSKIVYGIPYTVFRISYSIFPLVRSDDHILITRSNSDRMIRTLDFLNVEIEQLELGTKVLGDFSLRSPLNTDFGRYLGGIWEVF